MPTDAANPRPSRALSAEQAEQFLEDGYTLVREVFARSLARDVQDMVWAQLPEDRDDPASWTRPRTVIQQTITDPPAPQVYTDRYLDALADLCGPGRFETPTYVGYTVVSFPVAAQRWEPTNWHVDGNHFHHHVGSPQQGLISLTLLSDIEPEGGGTAIRKGSHREVARALAESEPAGLSPAECSRIARHRCAQLPIVEAVGDAGDVLLMHPHLLHASSTNRRPTPRIAANLCISLHAPMNFERDDPADESLVERAVRDAVASAKRGSSAR